ncbi:DNA topoisomerase III [Bacillus sp. TS-2]|nr:DNA topoisomerase III [Bacillus sp. TS-2]
MMKLKELFVCEKPSVARDLAMTLSNKSSEKQGFIIGDNDRVYTYAFGHLVTCKNPDELNKEWGWKGDISSLPFFIRDIPRKVISGPGIQTQFKVIVDLMKKAETIYIATDAGREGEHIFRKIYALSGVNKPLKRLWMQDMTKQGITKAFNNVKDGSLYEGLALAGKLREESDLLIGINSTLLMSRLSKSNKLLSLGRVQTPTLAMVVERDAIIENFKKEKHYTIVANGPNDFKFELDIDKETRLSKSDAQNIINELGERKNFNVSIKERKEKPQKLFNLTELQKYMIQKYKWSAAQTLKITQALYEKKLVTYPRTNSQYIANDIELPELLQKHSSNKSVQTILENDYKLESSFVNPGKVTDHEAIIITTKEAPSLSNDLQLLYDIIFTRFIAAFYPGALKEETVITFDDSNYTFKCKETSLVELGWRSLYGETVQAGELKHTSLSDITNYAISEKVTGPPKRYTEGTLLGDMENAAKFLDESEDKKLMKSVEGIGTVATRASIIETLVDRGFIEKKKGQVISTKLGRELINMMPKDFSLYSVKLTAFFETMLLEIENNNLSEDTFYEELEGLIRKVAKEIRGNVKPIEATRREVIATCPVCKKEMYENKKAYYCSGFKEGCKLSVWKNGLEKLGKKNITKNEAKKLLDGKVIKVKLKSKAGNDYKTDVVLNKEKGWIEFANSK